MLEWLTQVQCKYLRMSFKIKKLNISFNGSKFEVCRNLH